MTEENNKAATFRNQKLPKFINKNVDKKALGKLLAQVYENHGNAVAARLGNNLKDLGFKYATKAAVTISIEDLTVPPKKKDLLQDAENELKTTTDRFERGEITEVERYNKVIDTWSETNEKVTEAVVEYFDRLNPVYMMAFSGARGSIAQVRQLVGMRGLMADSEGKIIDLPIKSNFKEGLSVPEYMISAYGARKGLVDTALKTADSGYLTRRLVDVAQDVIIRNIDCGTARYITMNPLMDGEAEVLGISGRITGRIAVEDVLDPKSNEVIVAKGDIINIQLAEKIEEAGIKEVKIRSVLTCESKYGVCKQCYGWSTTDNKTVNLGEAIGIIAAQSIGEPGTQLTMRTFHTGGAVAGSGKSRETYKAPCDGTVSYDVNTREIRTKYGDIMFQVTKAGSLKIGSETIKMPLGARIAAKDGEKVNAGQYLGDAPELSSKQALTEKASKDVITLGSGLVEFENFQADEITDRQGNISKQANKQGTIWVQAGEVLPLPTAGNIIVEKGQQINKGDTLAESTINCENDGEVRYAADLLVEKTQIGDRQIMKLNRGRLINVINASIGAANAQVEQNQQGNNVWVLDDESEKYQIKVVHGELIESGKILCELVDDDQTPMLPCSGEVRFDGLEIDDRKIVTKHGRIIFIPEEIHVLSKDSSLVNNKTGDFVTAGSEIVKDVHTTIDGIVKVVIENNIVHEVTITPGELYDIEDPSELKFEDGDIVKKGVEVLPGISTKQASMITLFANEETGETKLLLREVQLFDIAPRGVNFEAETTDADISIIPVTQMNFKDGDRVRNINGGALTKTSLLMYCKEKYKESKGLVEIEDGKFDIIFQENIILRSDSSPSTITEVLVKPGDFIKAKSPIARVQTIAKSSGEVFYSESDPYRILVQTNEDTFTLESSAKVKEGDYILAGDNLDKSTVVPESGRVLKTDGKTITVRKAQPFLVSLGTRLHADNFSLVQQGDQLATIIYERLKTGDIVQGLPKVEELLEGRKPKDPAVLTDISGKVEVVNDEGTFTVYVQGKDERKEFALTPGQNVIVDSGDEVEVGDALTDGQPSPPELLELKGLDQVQQFLVNEVQGVYISQGVEIANKHIEVIVRQMTRKVKISDPGDTHLLHGEMHERFNVDQINEEIKADGKVPAEYEHQLLGLTKASLNTESFISAASFQETTRILAEASIKGKVDWLHGLKENIIIGRLIPSGTGFEIAEDGDEALQATDNDREELVQAIG